MTDIARISAAVPLTVADDIEYYADESGIYTDGRELAVEALRTMLMDVTAGFKDELDDLMQEYRDMLEVQMTTTLEMEVPRGLADRVWRLLPAIGYDMNAFVTISLMRRVNEVAMYEDDESERFGEECE